VHENVRKCEAALNTSISIQDFHGVRCQSASCRSARENERAQRLIAREHRHLFRLTDDENPTS